MMSAQCEATGEHPTEKLRSIHAGIDPAGPGFQSNPPALSRHRPSCGPDALDSPARLAGDFRGDFRNGWGLWIRPCRGVHTLAMGFPIDVVYLDRAGKVVHLEHNLQPWRFSPIRMQAASVLELPSHTVARTGTALGDNIEIKMKEDEPRSVKLTETLQLERSPSSSFMTHLSSWSSGPRAGRTSSPPSARPSPAPVHAWPGKLRMEFFHTGGC